MTVKKISDYINKSVISGLVLTFTLTLTGSAFAKNPAKSLDPQKGIVGVWQLNRTASDKFFKHAPAKNTLLPAPLTIAPESLILAADEEVGEITINEGFQKVLHTQTLPTDGTVITKNVQLIGQVSAKAFWKDKKLVVEVTTERGDKMTEIFELSGNQKRLNVTLQVNDAHSTKPMTVKRVYNRMTDQVSAEDRTAEIGISELPL